MRVDGRRNDELRPVSVEPGFLRHATGSCLMAMGGTRVLCAAMAVSEVPPWMRAQKVPGGWLTAEYQLLPQSTSERCNRERKGAGGRTHEIQRLIGRSLRAACDLKLLGPMTLYVDCDVLDADGGTRCASVTGAMIALKLAVAKLMKEGKLERDPLVRDLAAVSVGMLGSEPILDLCYVEDRDAEVDMNVVMTSSGEFVELQATAEGAPFTQSQHSEMLALAVKGLKELFAFSAAAVK